MIDVLMLPVVFWMELLDILMAFIPERVWDWLWRDARSTGSNEVAAMTDGAIRVVLSVTVIAAVLWIVL